ncbi:hypothetical protein OXX59_009030 [Metschnikowia pulcherrima]
MSTDRQALLEQKRKRLQELKERRSGVAQVNVSGSDLTLLAAPEPARPKVDFAVQVDFVKPAETAQKVDNSGDFSNEIYKPYQRDDPGAKLKFDKTVQTHFERLVELDLTPTEDTNSPDENDVNEEVLADKATEEAPMAETKTTQEKVESSLESFLAETGFRFSDLRLGVKNESTTNSDMVAPFHVIKSVSGFVNRPVIAIALTPDHPDVFVAAYGPSQANLRSKKRPSTASAGLAVLYNKSGDTIVPEFFLQCTSRICKIMFDETNPFKVFAGLENGRVVMWDLANATPTRVAVLPTLQTSTVASSVSKAENKFLHHVSPIVHLAQLNTNTSQSSGILSICADGVVNLWSPNFLAFPKIASIRLSDPEMGPKIPFKVNSVLITSTIFRVPEHTGHQNPPEYNFLHSAVLASKNGFIYKLANAKEKSFIKCKLGVPPAAGGPSARGVSALAELKYSAAATFLVSAHANWTLKFWDSDSGHLRHVTPTSTLIQDIIVRPGHGSQFITVSTVRPPKVGLFVEFWDIKTRLLSPVSTISTPDKKSGTVSFNKDGSGLFLAYDDGGIDVFSIEESLLASQVQSQALSSIDEGLEKLLASL